MTEPVIPKHCKYVCKDVYPVSIFREIRHDLMRLNKERFKESINYYYDSNHDCLRCIHDPRDPVSHSIMKCIYYKNGTKNINEECIYRLDNKWERSYNV